MVGSASAVVDRGEVSWGIFAYVGVDCFVWMSVYDVDTYRMTFLGGGRACM